MPLLDTFRFDILVAIGAALILTAALRFQIHRLRVARVASVPIKDVTGGFVQIRGTVSVGRDGIVHAPLSGRPCVWVRITLDAETGPAGARWRNLTQEVLTKDFDLRDATGAVAHVVPKRAEVRSTEKQTTVIGPQDEASSTFIEYLISQGGTLPEVREAMSSPGSVRAIEEVILVGDEVSVVGKARKTGGEIVVAGGPMYIAHEDVATLARDGRLWDGRARP